MEHADCRRQMAKNKMALVNRK